MKKVIKYIAIAVVAMFVVIQFFRIDRTNPPVVEAEALEAAVNVPADVSQILARSCNDCHSHKTIYPWYSHLQPSAWFLRDHIDHARSHLNFSVFNTYGATKKTKALDEICEEVESEAMPLPSYLWLHGDAVLSKSDGKVLCDWAKAERDKIDLQSN